MKPGKQVSLERRVSRGGRIPGFLVLEACPCGFVGLPHLAHLLLAAMASHEVSNQWTGLKVVERARRATRRQQDVVAHQQLHSEAVERDALELIAAGQL